jgi:hypothetical protein
MTEEGVTYRITYKFNSFKKDFYLIVTKMVKSRIITGSKV